MANKKTKPADAPLYQPEARPKAPPADVKKQAKRKVPASTIAAREALKEQAERTFSAVEHTPMETGHAGITADASLSPKIKSAAPAPEEQLRADIARIRATRRPFGNLTQKLYLPPIPGYMQHWFNDEPGRIDQAVQGGWANVEDSQGRPIKRVVGRSRESGAMYGYAMKLPKQLFDEDMALKHAHASERVETIRKTPFSARAGTLTKQDDQKFYSAKEMDQPVAIQQPHR